MSKKIKLYDAIQNSYAKKDKQKDAFKNQGYIFDSDLSDDNNQVYYNNNDKKMLYTVAGSHNLKDAVTDAYLLGGNLKSTSRYKNSEENLRKAKAKYNPEQTTIAGHSLGGSIGQYIAGANDSVVSLDKGATFGTKTRSNETAYRTKGDLVSVLNGNSTRMTNLKNPNFQTGILPIDILNAHNVSNIKDEDIFI